MKITKRSLFNPFSDLKTAEKYARETDGDVENIIKLFGGRVRFGGATDGTGTITDGNRGENLSGEFRIFTSDVTPDTEFSLTHTLRSVPVGRIILYQDIAGHLYQGPSTGTAWTDTTVFFKSDVASVTFAIFLLK